MVRHRGRLSTRPSAAYDAAAAAGQSSGALAPPAHQKTPAAHAAQPSRRPARVGSPTESCVSSLVQCLSRFVYDKKAALIGQTFGNRSIRLAYRPPRHKKKDISRSRAMARRDQPVAGAVAAVPDRHKSFTARCAAVQQRACPVTSWRSIIRVFRVKLRGRNLPAHFFCLIVSESFLRAF